jgi:DNA-binding transcriptional ArsR family regulator
MARSEENEKQVTAIFSALADPTRRQILKRLTERGESRVTALARPFRMSLPAISRHLRVLEEARLVKRRRAGRVHWIRVNLSGLNEGQRWIARYAEFWEARFEAMDEILKNEKRKDKRR